MKTIHKARIMRVSTGIISAGLPIAVVVSQFDFFIQQADTTVSAVALIALIVGAVSFKDAVLKFFKTPSALKIWAVLFVLAVLLNNIIYQFLIVSAWGLAAQGVCIPLHMLDKKFTEQAEKEKESSNED